MENRKLQIPTGMQDTLPGECRAKRKLEDRLRGLFMLHGYQEIETPVLEYYNALDDATYGYRPESVWKTFDRTGQVLALRPDSTIPAVRLAAGRLRSEPLPLRLCYLQNMTKYTSDPLSMLCEQTQAGVELMGESSVQADAEVIALAIETLKAAGLRDFQIELGQAGFFQGFMQEAGLSDADCETMRVLVEQKNTLGMQLYLQKLDVSADVTRRLMRLPRLYGDASVLDEAASLTNHALCRQSLHSLRQVIDILRAYGFGDYLTIDLGMVHEQGYYSGLIFQGQTRDLGQPLLSGGRYDGLPERFGRSMPAVGFALSLKLLMIALERQGTSFQPPVPDCMVGFEQGCLKQAVEFAREAREKGISVSMQYDAAPGELRDRVARGLCRQAVYLSSEGMQRFGGKAAEGGDR